MNTNKEPVNAKKLLSPKELSEFLGVSLNTVYSWTYQKLIPYIKIGRLARFEPIVVEAWINERRIAPFKMS